MVRIFDYPDITSAVYHGLEARNQTNFKMKTSCGEAIQMSMPKHMFSVRNKRNNIILYYQLSESDFIVKH